MSGQYKASWLREALLVLRSGYYACQRTQQQPGPRRRANLALRQRIRDELARSRNTYGSPRLAQVLGCPGSHNRIARLMRQERSWARQRSKFRVAATDSRHDSPIAPNRILEFKAERPDQLWVTDATCVLTGEGWLYVVGALDTHTRRLLWWSWTQSSTYPCSARRCRWPLSEDGRRPG